MYDIILYVCSCCCIMVSRASSIWKMVGAPSQANWAVGVHSFFESCRSSAYLFVRSSN